MDESATKIQSIYRGKTARDQKEEASRLEWIQFYRGTGQLSKAKELGWEPEAEAQPQAQPAPPSFTAPTAEVTPLVVANLSTTSREASRTASPRKSPRSNHGLRGWFSSLFGVVNDYDDPTLEYDGNSTNGVNTHQSATKLQAAVRGQLARRQAAAAKAQARALQQSTEDQPRALQQSTEDQAAATLQRARRRSVESRADAAARVAAEGAAVAERVRREEEEEQAAAAALKAGVEAGSPTPGGLSRKAMEDGTCRQLRGVMCAACRAQQGRAKLEQGRGKLEQGRGKLEVDGWVASHKPRLSSGPRRCAQGLSRGRGCGARPLPRVAPRTPLTTQPRPPARWKRNAAFPRYQPRYVFVERLDGGGFGFFYRSGDEDGTGDGELRRIPLDSVSSVGVLDGLRYEFALVSSTRKAKYRFRVDKEEKLEIWTKGLNFLRGCEPGGRASSAAR
jgi:hypothetical protein